MARRVLVTGAAGAIGGRLLHALSEAGWLSRALVHRRAVPEADEQAHGDVADPASVRAALEDVDAVLHLAALTHARRERDYFKVNAEGTTSLLEAAARAGVHRFVHVSTRAIAADGGAYSRSKLAAERAVESSPLEHVIVRLPEVFGAGGREGVDDMLARASRGAPLALVGRGDDRLCPVHVDDIVGPLVAALEAQSAAGRTYTLAGACLPMRELAETCVRATGSSSRVVSVPVALLAGAGVLARALPIPLYPDQLARLRSDKPPATPEAAADLGFRPRPLDQGLAEAAARQVASL